MAMGALDAAIVWQAVAHLFRDRLEIVPIGAEYTAGLDAVTSATYKASDLGNVQVTIGITKHARNRWGSRRFYDFVVNDCRDVFAAYGFRTGGGKPR